MKSQNPGKTATGGQTGGDRPETFTKDQVRELMRRRVERSHQSYFNRYGVKDLNEMDALFGKAKSVADLTQRIEELTHGNADLQTRFDELTNRHRDLTKRYAFAKGNVKPEAYPEIERRFAELGIDIDEESLNGELASHPEWVGAAGTVTPIGAEPSSIPNDTERDFASRIFGVDL